MGDGGIKRPEEVVGYWCETLTAKDWWQSTPELDQRVRDQFAETHLALSRDVAPEWRASPEARLAAIIVLDQFPRNMYRASPMAFSTDWIARREARLALEAGADRLVDYGRRHFFYMPFEHSETLADQDLSVSLFEAHGDEMYLDYAMRHRDVIAEYGRFPHRNAFLGRVSTPEEEAYLAEPGAGF
ncbi:DUF924 family protein [Shinella zoogloeoides]|jgi:uncharacterized protein (DUF924 family)|uniref:DUF924 family protein n=1 Tax=Shinella zoogloeoides TaxID=352475 RepID=UPI00273F4687|nr:DUF924 family protein [Shinella zoogloeoides]WLR91045.1 DUF924 family protein [Shinella zoogloeoides]